MVWLYCDGKKVSQLEVADNFFTRLKGLLGKKNYDKSMIFYRVSSVHTIGMRFSIDVAFCDEDMFVIDIIEHMRPYSISLPRRYGKAVVEASAGSFKKWGITKGSKLEVRP